MVAVDVRSVQILHTSRRRDVFAGSMSAANPSRDVSSYNVTSQAARESIADIELMSTSSPQTLPFSGAGVTGQSVVAAEKSGFLRPRLNTHPGSAAPEHLTPDTEDRILRQCTLTSRLDDAITTHQQHQTPAHHHAKPDHLRVHTGTGCRVSRGYIRSSAGGRNSLGVVKMHGRERRAGRTLIWVFAIFVALWLPFFCTNLAYGICGTVSTSAASNSSATTAAATTTTTMVFDVVPESTSATNRSASDVFGGVSAGCNVPESVFVAFTWLGYLSHGTCHVVHVTWLGYLSSGVNPLVYTILNHDFQNAFRTIITCHYFSATSASRRQSRANLFN